MPLLRRLRCWPDTAASGAVDLLLRLLRGQSASMSARVFCEQHRHRVRPEQSSGDTCPQNYQALRPELVLRLRSSHFTPEHFCLQVLERCGTAICLEREARFLYGHEASQWLPQLCAVCVATASLGFLSSLQVPKVSQPRVSMTWRWLHPRPDAQPKCLVFHRHESTGQVSARSRRSEELARAL